jgi:hypothetical protein
VSDFGNAEKWSFGYFQAESSVPNMPVVRKEGFSRKHDEKHKKVEAIHPHSSLSEALFEVCASIVI